MIKPDILLEDKHILLVRKPAGVLSQGASHTDLPDMVSILEDYLKASAPDTSPYVGVVHRLDCAVGGVMVYAKKPYAAAALSEAVRTREFTKEYLCIVNGCPEESEAELCDLLWKDARQNKVYVVDRMRNGVREARLSYRLLDTKETADGPLSLLLVTLGTGRSHQIRAQLSHHGMPIACDGKYGGRRPANTDGDAVALWSTHLAFAHPANTERSRNGRKPNPKAPVFENPDVWCFPPEDTMPWALFAGTLTALAARKKENEHV